MLEKLERRLKNSIVIKYGPITIGEGRLRAAADDNLRLQKKRDEEERILTKSRKAESEAVARWIRRFRAKIRKIIPAWKKNLKA